MIRDRPDIADVLFAFVILIAIGGLGLAGCFGTTSAEIALGGATLKLKVERALATTPAPEKSCSPAATRRARAALRKASGLHRLALRNARRDRSYLPEVERRSVELSAAVGAWRALSRLRCAR